LSLPPLKQKTAKAKQNIAQAQKQSQTKKNARAQENISPVATTQTKFDAHKL
jgi:hypothetical protein